MKNTLWKIAGILSLGLAYIGIIMPGIPWSTPAVFAAYCFAKGSPRMHKWIYGHKLFGPFLTNWETKRVFPRKAKYLMVVTMCSSLAVMFFTGVPLNGIAWTAAFMAGVVVWGWRYPDSVEEHDRRVAAGKKIAWLK